MGMRWNEIMKYRKVILYIAKKYSNDHDLADDVAQEVMLRLYEDKRLNTAKFDPKKKDAAIRNTIRNKAIKVLKSRKVGRWVIESLDVLGDAGYQIDTGGRIIQDVKWVRPPEEDDADNDLT